MGFRISDLKIIKSLYSIRIRRPENVKLRKTDITRREVLDMDRLSVLK